MASYSPAAAFLLIILAIAGCGSANIVAFCAAPKSRAIDISVRDSVTGDAAAIGASGTIESAGVVDTLVVNDSLRMSGGSELGFYDVTVQRAGYRTWTASHVHVTKVGPCGNVEPAELSARLQPATP